MKNPDRRTRKSKKVLQNALAQLLLQKDLAHITVKELTQLADVNRGTFYTHYQDIYEFVEVLENEIVENVRTALKSCSPTDTRDGLLPLLEAFNMQFETAPKGIPLLTEPSAARLTKKLYDMICQDYLKLWIKTYTGNADEQLLDYYCTFLFSGIFSMAVKWLNTPQKERISAKESAVLMNQLILYGLSSHKN